MELSEEEKRIVYQFRYEKEQKLMPEIAHILDVTSRYTRWLNDNGAGSTYSTFCNDFGYEPEIEEDRSLLFEKVTALRGEAKRIAVNHIERR